MTENMNYNYMNFMKYLERRDEIGDSEAIAEFKVEQAQKLLDFMVSAGEHQKDVTISDCVVVSQYVEEKSK